MHSYLRAVGFSNINNRVDLDKLIGIVMDQPTGKYSIKKSDKSVFTEISRDFGEKIGITIRGEYDEKGFFYLEHYFPYFTGSRVTAKEEIVVNKRVDNEAYTGMCDDLRLGVSLIFYLQNVVDFLNRNTMKNGESSVVPVILSALSIEGSILLGIETDTNQAKKKSAESKQRNKLISEARKGNQEAIDSLTIDDIDLYAIISRRSKYEDVYSIVESSFIPYGSESDNYSIIGTIVDWKSVKNVYTNEELFDILIECNDLVFNVCINKLDLQGEPMTGRRFKGNIWMQGNINF